jgi:hypothetical protein
VLHHEQADSALAIGLRGVLDRAERDELGGTVAVEIRDRGRGVREVRLLFGVLVVRVALLRERVVDHPANAGELRAIAKDRRGVERATGAVVQ